jgi:hypothetical protein
MAERIRLTRTRLSASELRAVAVHAGADPRTVQKLVTGAAVAPLVGERIARALIALGLAEPSAAPGAQSFAPKVTA